MVSNTQAVWKHDIGNNRNRDKNIELSENDWNARLGSSSMVGLEAERLNPINVKSKAMEPFDLYLRRSFAHVKQITS